MKINDTGAIQWQKCFGGSGSDQAAALQQTLDGGYIVTGSSMSADGEVTGNHGNMDYWIVKLNDSGTFQWEKSVGGSLDDLSKSILQTPDGGFIVAGESLSNDDDVSGNHGNYDYWVVKLNCGLSAGSISGSDNVCNDSSITLTDTASGGTWSVTNGRAAIAGDMVTGLAVGADTAIYTVLNSCGVARALFPFNVISCPDEVTQISSNSLMSVAPNPTTGDIVVIGPGCEYIRVYNLLGQLLKEAEHTGRLSISELPAGMYFVRAYSREGKLIMQDKISKQ